MTTPLKSIARKANPRGTLVPSIVNRRIKQLKCVRLARPKKVGSFPAAKVYPFGTPPCCHLDRSGLKYLLQRRAKEYERTNAVKRVLFFGCGKLSRLRRKLPRVSFSFLGTSLPLLPTPVGGRWLVLKNQHKLAAQVLQENLLK